MCDRPLSQAAGKTLKSPKRMSTTNNNTRSSLGLKSVASLADRDSSSDDDSRLLRRSIGAKPVSPYSREWKM